MYFKKKKSLKTQSYVIDKNWSRFCSEKLKKYALNSIVLNHWSILSFSGMQTSNI